MVLECLYNTELMDLRSGGAKGCLAFAANFQCRKLCPYTAVILNVVLLNTWQ